VVLSYCSAKEFSLVQKNYKKERQKEEDKTKKEKKREEERK
jgi:hypothetical protein